MRRIGKVLLTIGVILVAIAVVLVGVGAWFVRRPWSQVGGTLTVVGLEEPVEVVRDEWGVPHIYAGNEHDLFWAQGYVHAQDRLWQMEFNRCVGCGKLCSFLGENEELLDTDRFLRTIGLRRAAEKDWLVLDDETRDILEAYAEGVNAYVEMHRDRLPLEFTILGVDPLPWTSIDSLAWGKMMCFDLGGNYKMELLRADIIARLGERAAQELMPPYSEGAPIIVPREARDYSWLRGATYDGLKALEASLGGPRIDWGSNNWVVHGSHIATGKPLLANDMHLGLNMPSIWYEIGLHGGRFDSVGYSFPGAPLVIVGHNSRVAWGVTNLGPDVQDFYIESLNDRENPTQYEFMGEWHDLEVLHESIEVKGCEPVQLDVLVTRHGPIMNAALDLPEDAEPLALKWTALEGGRIFRAVTLINLASNWDEFRHAVSFWDVPSQNFVYADVDGNVGYQSPGLIPIRESPHQGLVPVPGWSGEYEWKGYIPFDELPSVLNPPCGFIATANNKVVPDDYPYHLAYEWAAPYRAQRITDLLAADDDVTMEDIRNIHADTYSLPAEALRSHLLAIEPENELQALALAQVEAWDLRNEADRPGASVFQVWYWSLVANTLGDELVGEADEGATEDQDSLLDRYLRSFNNMPMMVELMDQAGNPWFDDVTTPETENRDDIARRSLSEAVTWLSERLGKSPEKWAWGRLHTMTFVHQPLGQSGIGIIEGLFNSKSIPARGSGYTVDAASFEVTEDEEQPFVVRSGVSQRQIIDLSDLDASLSIHTTGQSGQLFHPHREDFISAWQDVEYHPMLFSRTAVEANAESALRLEPR